MPSNQPSQPAQQQPPSELEQIQIQTNQVQNQVSKKKKKKKKIFEDFAFWVSGIIN